MYKKLALIIGLFIPSYAFALEEANVVKFFNDYQQLSSEFDASVNTFYADDAKIMGVRKKPDGTEENLTIDGKRWKTIILSSMEQAKQMGDNYTYSNTTVEVSDSSAKISSTRYSELLCFSDERFYMVVNTNAENDIQIVEQFMESPAQSNCENTENDLSEFLERTVTMINEQLPAAIDAETQLIKTSSEGNKLIYHYVLINYTSETLSEKEATRKLQPVVLQQSCTSPNLRPILDQGGSLSYIYRGSDAAQIVAFTLDISACEN